MAETSDVTAGNGMVIDWRMTKSGETMREGADAFDAAHLAAFCSTLGGAS